MQPDDESIIPQDDLYVLTWETKFGDFPNSTKEITIPTLLDVTDTPNGVVDDATSPGENFTNVDLGPTGPHENDDFDLTEKTRLDRTDDQIDDQ